MTLEQISALTVTECSEALVNRIRLSYNREFTEEIMFAELEIYKVEINNPDLVLDDCEDIIYQRVVSHYNPTQEELEEELIIYKEELTVAENARLILVAKIEQIQSGVSSLIDNNSATIAAFPESASNYSLWIKNSILENVDIDTALANLSAIQAKEIELEAQRVLELVYEAKAENGRKCRDVCNKVYDIIAGYNNDRELTVEQVTSFVTQFSTAMSYLQANRPWAAKEAIQAVTVDGTIVTQEMYDAAIWAFSQSGLEGL